MLHNSSRCKKTQLPKLPPLQTWSLKIKLHLLFFFPSRDSHSAPPPLKKSPVLLECFFDLKPMHAKKFERRKNSSKPRSEFQLTKLWNPNPNRSTTPKFSRSAKRKDFDSLFPHPRPRNSYQRRRKPQNRRNFFREKISILSPAVPKQNLSNPKSF